MNLGEFQPTKKSVLCSLHFQEKFLIRKENSRRVLLTSDAVLSVSANIVYYWPLLNLIQRILFHA